MSTEKPINEMDKDELITEIRRLFKCNTDIFIEIAKLPIPRPEEQFHTLTTEKTRNDERIEQCGEQLSKVMTL